MGAATESIAQSGLSEQLVRACQDGSPEAQRELYECYKVKVYSLAIYLTGDAEMAKDLTQEIFLKVFRDLHAFRFESSFSSWLYRLATNTCLNALRSRRTRHEVCIEEVLGTPAEIDADSSLEQQQVNRSIQRAVRQAILSLKPPLRAVVVLRYIEHLSYGDIAEVLSCSEGTVASRLNRAHRLLERKLRSGEGKYS
ncbi:MAG: RNA polymerase sigma factor [Acidobacteria bacterium]|nr:RNA polymerase sigma factor [Acidobacteriota bacterium]